MCEVGLVVAGLAAVAAAWWLKPNKVHHDDDRKVEEIFAAVNLGFVLDASRTRVVQHVSDVVEELAGKHVDLPGNRVGRLLLGRKAMGKTCLLKALRKALLRRCHVRVVHMACNEEDCDFDLYRAIAAALGLRGHKFEQLRERVEKDKLVVVVLVDEFQLAYSEAGQKLIRHLHVASGTARFLCLVTGSSKYLRRLAFLKITPEEAREAGFVLPTSKLDLNTTKLQPTWLEAFTDANTFRQFMLSVHHIDDDQLMARAYLATGAIPGARISFASPSAFLDVRSGLALLD